MLSDIEMSENQTFLVLGDPAYRSLYSSEFIAVSGNISLNVFFSKLLFVGWININSGLINCNHKTSTGFQMRGDSIASSGEKL